MRDRLGLAHLPSHALRCRGYVQDRRRERLRDIRNGRPVEEPNPWGEAYLLEEEIAQRTEVDA